MKQDLKLNSVIIINNTQYLIKDKISLDRKKFYLLKNTARENDFTIRMSNELLPIKDDQKFDKIYNIFSQRNAF